MSSADRPSPDFDLNSIITPVESFKSMVDYYLEGHEFIAQRKAVPDAVSKFDLTITQTTQLVMQDGSPVVRSFTSPERAGGFMSQNGNVLDLTVNMRSRRDKEWYRNVGSGFVLCLNTDDGQMHAKPRPFSFNQAGLTEGVGDAEASNLIDGPPEFSERQGVGLTQEVGASLETLLPIIANTNWKNLGKEAVQLALEDTSMNVLWYGNYGPYGETPTLTIASSVREIFSEHAGPLKATVTRSSVLGEVSVNLPKRELVVDRDVLGLSRLGNGIASAVTIEPTAWAVRDKEKLHLYTLDDGTVLRAHKPLSGDMRDIASKDGVLRASDEDLVRASDDLITAIETRLRQAS